jgi:hypothetical protein
MAKVGRERRFGFTRTLLLLTCLAGISPQDTFAQTSYGSIVGTVNDASGASVPGATVTLTNLGTSEKRAADSDTNGNYQFVNLVPGKYRIDVEKPGFKHFTSDQIQVEVQSAVRIDAPMQVGDVGQTVEVSGQSPLLQTENATVGQVVEGQIVTDMPLNGRNVFALIALAPGVIPQGGALNGSMNFQISGGMPNQGVTFIDGAPFMNSKLNTAGFQPAQDVVQEFQVMSHNVGPEYGGTLNGVINIATKSGTNQFHGTAYEYMRNTVLNASTFFANKGGIPRPAYHQNQFGFTLGGPVIKNKMFFFAGYEGNRVRQGNTNTLTVPTAAERGGDFSNLRNSSGAVIPIYDPATTCGVLGNPACAPGQTVLRAQFPGNVIPTSRLDASALLLNKYWPLPNQAATLTNTNNYIVNYRSGSSANQTNVRLDGNVSDKQHMFGRFSVSNPYTIPADTYGTGGLLTTISVTSAQQGVFGDTYTFSPTTVLDLNLAVLRNYNTRAPNNLGLDLHTDIGWPVATNNQIIQKQLPEIIIPGFSNGGNRTVALFLQAIGDVESLSGSLTKISGRHTVKFGGEIRRIYTAYGQDAGGANVLSFSNAFTGASPLSPGSTGNGLASYMLGLGSSGNMVNIALPSTQQYYSGAYINDTFHMTSKLTINAGLRWEYTGYWTEKHDLQTVWLPGAVNPALQSAGLNYPGDIVLVNSPRYPDRHNTAPHYDLFSPRVGVAYRAFANTVLRSGFGIFYTPGTTVQNGTPYASPVNNAATPWVPTLDGGFTPTATLSNPFPNGVLPVPGRDPSYETLILGTQVLSPVPHDREPYMMNWHFGLERQFGDGLLIEAGYVGERGVHLYNAGGLVVNGMGFDQIPSQDLSLGTKLLQQVANPFLGTIKSGPLSSPTIPYGQLLLPYPQYAGVYSPTTAAFDNVYHSLETRVQKRFGTGGTILVSYTWAKNLGNADTMTGYNEFYQPGETQDYYNLRNDRSELSYDVPQRLVTSYVFELPVGKGKPFLSGVSGLTGKLISGWGISGITSLQSGFPIPMIALPTSLSTLFNAGVPRPNLVAGCNRAVSGAAQAKLNGWFNTSCFTQPSSFGFGNEARADSVARTHGIANWDFSITKETALTERIGLSARMEVYNLFNRVQFSPPGNQLGSQTFGVVSGQLNAPRQLQVAMRLTF